jgi:penicillin amidase
VRRGGRWLVRGLLWLLLLAGIAALAAWLALRASLPDVEGEAKLAGLAGRVLVERDAQGVPVIRGANRLDVARATGFVHAQERFFQMDLTRRAAAGELAALLGPALLPTDRRMRVHRFRARAAEVLRGAAPADLALLQAYAEGVNAGLEALDARPFEYLLLRQPPQPWRAEDALLVVFAMWVDLQGGGFRAELQQERLHAALPEALYRLVARSPSTWDAALDGTQLEPPPLPAPGEYDLRRVDPSLFDSAGEAAASQLRFTWLPGEVDESMVGSNNWALAGRRTASGRALVANDMHLGLRVPNTWYRARLVVHSPAVDVTGVMLPGAPIVVAGSNGHVAWGFTNSYGDYIDLVRVEPDGQGGYLTPDGPRRMETVEEVIEVAGAAPETLAVEQTVWGPVVDRAGDGTPLAMAWTAHRPEAVNLRLVGLETAADLDEAIAIAASAGIPAQNAMIGDAQGRIAWVIAGRIPVRGDHDPMLPSSWTSAGAGWRGWVEGDDQPRIVDPAFGFAWSANARVVGGDMLAAIGDGGYAHGARGRQIRDALAGLQEAGPEDFLGIHLDDRAVYLSQWQTLLRRVLIGAGKEQAPVLALVRDWSGHAAVDDAGYRLVREFERVVTDRAFAMLTVEARARWPGFGWRAPSRFTDVAWRLVNERPAQLLDPRYESWDAWLRSAAEAAIAEAQHGCEAPVECTWGRRNVLRIQHPLSQALPVLSGWLDMPAQPLPGDWSMPRVQSPGFGASERFAVEPGREEAGYFHMPGGQSGHPLSPFYRAGHDDWVQGRPTPFLPGPTEYLLTLHP